MNILAAIIAEAAAPIDFTSLSGWWELAKTIGPGATLVMGIGLWWANAELARRNAVIKEKETDLKAEVTYSKDLTTKQLTVISELATLIRGIDQRDRDSVTAVDGNTTRIINAIADLKTTVIQHALASNGSQSHRSSAA